MGQRGEKEYSSNFILLLEVSRNWGCKTGSFKKLRKEYRMSV